jgi:hypothetical protein
MTRSSERIFNVFIYFEDGIALNYGIKHHRHAGNDSEKLAFLQATVENDFLIARHFPLPRSFTQAEWITQYRLGMDIGIFEEGFAHFHANQEPIMAITSIVNGCPRVDIMTDLSPYWGEKVGKHLPGDMQDWLIKYTDGNTFRFDHLFNDDYFLAIKLLFNARYVASAAKLLMSCIDTIAFIEHGDTRDNFKKWLHDFVNLATLGISVEELWEFRNSIVHMTNLSSRKVIAGKVSPIIPYIGSDELAMLARSPDMKPFNFYSLISAVGIGIKKWGESYNDDRDKFMKFIERYDTLVSDSRLAEFAVDTPTT